MGDHPSQDEQTAAWRQYAELRQKADQTLLFDDGRRAVEAWIAFMNLYLPDGQKLPLKRTTGGNVVAFPFHKASLPTAERS